MSERRDQSEGEERIWEAGWDGHESAQRRRMAKLPMSEKLAWLEEAHRLIRNMQKGKDRGDGSNPPTNSQS